MDLKTLLKEKYLNFKKPKFSKMALEITKRIKEKHRFKKGK